MAALPLVIVVGVNLVMSFFVLPRLDASYLADEFWGSTSLSAVGGVWSVVTALAVAIVTLIAVNYRRLPALRISMDAGANASVLPSVASLVGFGSVVAALPAFAMVRDRVLSIDGGPLVSLAVATNVLASLTGSASGGLTIALDALGATYIEKASERRWRIERWKWAREGVPDDATLYFTTDDGAYVPIEQPDFGRFDDEFEDFIVQSEHQRLRVTDIGRSFLLSALRASSLNLRDTLGDRVMRLFEIGFYDTAIREACVRLEHEIRVYTRSDAWGDRLTEEFVVKLGGQ